MKNIENEYEMQIYRKKKKEIYRKIINETVKSFGFIPILIMTILNSVIVSFVLTELWFFHIDLTNVNMVFGEHTILIVYAFMTLCACTFLSVINILSIVLCVYTYKLTLNDKK